MKILKVSENLVAVTVDRYLDTLRKRIMRAEELVLKHEDEELVLRDPRKKSESITEKCLWETRDSFYMKSRFHA